MLCPCGTSEKFENCCKSFISGEALPETAEQLMRSRYSAYASANIDYLKSTLAPDAINDFDEEDAKEWAQSVKWKNLRIISVRNGGAKDKQGTVEFGAIYEQDGEEFEHHEVSQFKKSAEGKWLFVDGDAHTHKAGEHHHHHPHNEPIVNVAPKIGRNDPCLCGSLKKYKKCCGA